MEIPPSGPAGVSSAEAPIAPGVFVAVGSNIDPETHIVSSLEALLARVRVVDTSTFYLTEPVGAPGTPRFYNGVWRIETELAPLVLKQEVLRGVEDDLGRKRSGDKYAPRVIDLDLILYGDQVIDQPGLTLPDPDIYTRPFVAVPLKELCPDGILRDTGSRISALESANRKEALLALTAFTSHLKGILHHE